MCVKKLLYSSLCSFDLVCLSDCSFVSHGEPYRVLHKRYHFYEYICRRIRGISQFNSRKKASKFVVHYFYNSSIQFLVQNWQRFHPNANLVFCFNSRTFLSLSKSFSQNKIKFYLFMLKEFENLCSCQSERLLGNDLF